MKDNITESSSKKVQDMNKEDLRAFIKDVFDEEIGKQKSKIVGEDKVRQIVRSMLKKQYELFWQKSSFFLDKL